MHAVVITPGQSQLSLRCEDAGIPIYDIASRNDLDGAAGYRVSRVIRDLKPCILHAHSGRAVSMASLGRWLAGSAARIVFSRRVSFPLRNVWYQRRKFRFVDRFLPISREAAQPFFAMGFDEKRIEIIHEGVAPNRWPVRDGNSIRNEFQIPNSAIVIGTVGHCDEVKNQAMLLKAAALLDEHTNLRCIIVGDGALRESLQSKAKELGIADRCIFPGFRTDVGSFFDAFDLFVITSTHEGLCTSIMDAHHSRVPVIATNVGGIPELIEDGVTGHLVRSHDAEHLASKIRELVDDETKLGATVEAAWSRACEMFTVERMVEKTTLAYQKALDSPLHQG